jgi:hypothetical protein
MTPSTPQPVMWVPRMDVFLHKWFTTYEEARATHQVDGGYLLPYRSHFFLAQAESIRELGLDPDDPDWERIGRDWVRPLDVAAWERLAERRVAVAK